MENRHEMGTPQAQNPIGVSSRQIKKCEYIHFGGIYNSRTRLRLSNKVEPQKFSVISSKAMVTCLEMFALSFVGVEFVAFPSGEGGGGRLGRWTNNCQESCDFHGLRGTRSRASVLPVGIEKSDACGGKFAIGDGIAASIGPSVGGQGPVRITRTLPEGKPIVFPFFVNISVLFRQNREN